MATIGLLARFRGMLIHDHGSAYAGYDYTQAYGNVHHPRELITIAENYPRRRWPQALIDLLCEANEATKMARAAGFAALPHLMVEDFFTRHDDILAAAARQHPPTRQTAPHQIDPVYNPIARLQEHHDEVPGFITDLSCPLRQ